MVAQYTIKKTKSYVFSTLLIAFILLVAYSQGVAYKQETQGYFEGYKNGEITIELFRNRGKEHFRVNDGTKVIRAGTPIKVSQIPKHSVVKVKSEGGVALEILIEEVPQ